MSQNIKDYGGVEGTNTSSARAANVAAINDASEAADDNTVYLPAGEWYIGPEKVYSGYILDAGSDTRTERGAAGLGFTGDGPEDSFLIFGSIESGTNAIWYSSDSSHPNVTYDNITIDGNYQSLDLSDASERALNIKGDGDFTFENVRVRNIYANGIHVGGSASASVSLNYCTLHDIGIGNMNDGNGEDGIGHGIVGNVSNGETLTVTNSELRLCGGNCIDFGYGSGDAAIENCYMHGAGDATFKINDISSLTIDKLYAQPQTQELLDAHDYDDSDGTEFRGRWCFKRRSGTSSLTPKVTIDDAYFYRMTRGIAYVADDGNGDPLDLDIVGHSGEPMRFETVAQDVSGGADDGFTDDAWGEKGSGGFNFDVQEMSAHDVDGTVFDLTNASGGTVSDLKRDNTDGVGSTGDVTVSTDEAGADPFAPDVPSQSEVGITSDTDSAPGVSWATPSDGSSVSGTVTVQINASDSEDANDSLLVEYRVDSGSWSTAQYNSDTGYYEDTWDTSSLGSGDHNLEAQVSDSAGNTSNAVISVVKEDPIYQEWTPKWSSTKSDYSCLSETSTYGDAVLELDAGSPGAHALKWDDAGTSSDVEVLALVEVPSFDASLSDYCRIYARGDGTSSSHECYFLNIRRDSFALRKYHDGGNITTLGSAGSPSDGQQYWLRMRVEDAGTGDNIVKGKFWTVGVDEPSSWDFDVEDTSSGVPDSGWVGVGAYPDVPQRWDVFSVATGGASAEFGGLDSAPSVSWASPAEGSTLSGSVTVQIDASDPEDANDSLAVEYRVDGGNWSTAQYNSDTGYYEDTWDTTSVSDGDHTLEAIVTDSGGNTSSSTLSVATDNSGNSPSVDSLSLAEVETDSTDAEFDADWQVSDSDGDLDTVELVLTQDSDGSVEDSTAVAVGGDTASGTTRVLASGDDGSGNSYTVDLIVTDGQDNTVSDSASVTETEDTNSAPTVDRFNVSEAGRPDPHAEITVVWDVSDSDGDLQSVDIDVADSSGTVQSVSWTVSGSTASDMDSFKIKQGDGKTFGVTLTVTDAAGESTSVTKSVTA